AFSTVLYVGAGLGPGPRDGLMTGTVVRTGLSVRLVRTSIEATVLTLGWLLGGTVGAGTVFYAFDIGPLVQFFVRIMPKRVLAVSGWASVAQASDSCTKPSAGNKSRTNRHTTMGRCQSPKEIQPTPTC
ncbi:MAG: YczE/YyaS/YitT family protein, partial [Mycobacterium sp.]